MKVLLTDVEQPDIDLERTILAEAGFEVALAQCRTPEDVIQAGRGAIAFLVQAAPITREVLEALPDLRFISCCGVGVDMVDLAAAREQGVWVANVPDAITEEVATHALGMILSLVRHLPFHDRAVRAGHWHYQHTGPLRRLSTMTLGLVGLGRIGRRLVQLAQPCFEQILAYDPYLPDSIWPDTVHQVELETIFQQSDVVSLHTPLTEETRNLINSQQLAQMRAGSYLVNVARGALVNLAALLQALDKGHLAGAALDVLPQEPPPADHPVLQHPQVLLSPHAAFYSVEGEEELRRKYALNVVVWAREGRPPYVVVEGRKPGP
jgi:D-3-phosphoglycerate dehydrogenase